MPIQSVAYLDCHIDAVRQFNGRLRVSRPDLKLPESPVPSWLPRTAGGKLYQEYFLGVDTDGAVRGGYILKHQMFYVRGRSMCVGVCQYPVSEGIVNPAYSMVGVLLLRDALKRQPYLYALGMGGMEEPYPRLLRAMRWKLSYVPFFFKVRSPRTFLKNIVSLRNISIKRAVTDVLAASGAGTILLHSIHGAAGVRALMGRRLGYEIIPSFNGWADSLCDEAKDKYAMTAIRDSRTLNILYPPEKPFHRLLVKSNGEGVGWAVMLATSMTGHKHFGNMRVGSVVDCMARPGYERDVVGASIRYLDQQQVDLMVSNQNHARWREGMRYAGFLRGTSNYVFGVSHALEELLNPFDESLAAIHMTRGDGDGPINL